MGTKLDLRDDKEQAESVDGGNGGRTTDAEKTRQKYRQIHGVFLCSSLNNFGIKEIFDKVASSSFKLN